MKKAIQTISVVLVLAAVFCLASCSEQRKKEGVEMTGNVETTVNVESSSTAKAGDILDTVEKTYGGNDLYIKLNSSGRLSEVAVVMEDDGSYVLYVSEKGVSVVFDHSNLDDPVYYVKESGQDAFSITENLSEYRGREEFVLGRLGMFINIDSYYASNIGVDATYEKLEDKTAKTGEAFVYRITSGIDAGNTIAVDKATGVLVEMLGEDVNMFVEEVKTSNVTIIQYK